jgi:hypothetical protein
MPPTASECVLVVQGNRLNAQWALLTVQRKRGIKSHLRPKPTVCAGKVIISSRNVCAIFEIINKKVRLIFALLPITVIPAMTEIFNRNGHADNLFPDSRIGFNAKNLQN